MSDEGWMQVATQRRRTADFLDGLTADQVASPSLCEDWTVHHVAAHLAGFCEFKLLGFLVSSIRAGFDFDKASDRGARKLAERPVPELAAVLRDKAEARPPLPMFDPEMVLTDVVIHGQDMAIPVDVPLTVDEAALEAVLVFVTTHKAAKTMLDPDRFAGLRLEATDIDWSHGDGPEAGGPAIDLLMAMAGRRVADSLSGDGVESLR